MATVLIADDMEFIRHACGIMLRNEGFTPLEAGTAAEALELYATSHPAVVLLDINLPDLNGLEVLKRIRALDPAAKIVILTAMSSQPHVLEAIRQGACDFLAKPFERMRLIQAVQRQLQEGTGPPIPA